MHFFRTWRLERKGEMITLLLRNYIEKFKYAKIDSKIAHFNINNTNMVKKNKSKHHKVQYATLLQAVYSDSEINSGLRY